MFETSWRRTDGTSLLCPLKTSSRRSNKRNILTDIQRNVVTTSPRRLIAGWEVIKNYDEDSNEEYIFEIDFEYSKYLPDLHSDLPFLPEKMKINKRKKLVFN